MREREKNKLLDGLFIERFGQAVPFGAIRDDRRPLGRRPSAEFPRPLRSPSYPFLSPPSPPFRPAISSPETFQSN